MGKKKAFINKKEAQHFHVVHRSQRDPRINDPEASKFVLLSATKPVEFDDQANYDDYDSDDSDLPDLVPQAAQAPAKQKVRFGNVVAEDLVNEFGMKNDGYDYSKHMKEMGRGQFYSAGGTYDEGANLLSKRIVLPDEVFASEVEHDRMLEAITLTEDVMDEDLREALVNDEAFEELNDDFIIQAAEDLPDEGATDGFDYDAHIAKLMAAAEGIPKYRGNLSDDEDDEDDDDEYYEEEEIYDEYDNTDRDEAQRALDEAFEKMMAEEYDDDQLGELEEEETRGKLVLEGALLEQIVDDYVNIRQELMVEEGRLGNPLRSGNRLKEIIAECAADLEEDMKPTDPEPVIEPADMSDLTENPYLVRRVDDEWDCETIVSTYSNLDNHPKVIDEPSRTKKKKKSKARQIAESSTIILSSKTGMPLNIVPLSANAPIPEEDDDESDEEDDRKPTPQLARGKGETKEEKKLRKAMAKNHKKERRQEKKEVKLMYKDEKQRQIQTAGPGLSVFRY